jgi:signal transduction histidine kinase
VTFISHEGVVEGDSDFDDDDLGLLENHRTRPEVEQALAAGLGVARRVSASTHRAELKVAIAAWPGVVRISAPLAQVDAVVERAARTIIGAALLAVVLATVLAAVGGRAVARPVRDLANAAASVGTGSKPAYPRSSVPEIRRLVHALRTMHEEINSHVAKLTREHQETEALIASMVEGVIATDASGRIVVCNDATRQLLGFGVEEALPDIRTLFHQSEAREIVEEVLADKPVLGREIKLAERSVLVTARPLPTGGAIIGMLDISDLKRLQTVRRDFIANVSHELKTPMTSIVGYTETLLAEDIDAETRTRFLNVIHENAERMRRIVDDLLDLARLESGSWVPNLTAVKLRTVVDAAWGGFVDQAAEKNVALDLEIASDEEVIADPQILGHILVNLFSNSLRHTPEGGRITVSTGIRDGDLEISVSDTGTGIPSEHVSRVVERFYRVDPGRSRHEGGTGLGLAIVKHLVEVHGGHVTIESTLGQGTTVSLRLPVEVPVSA